MKTPYLWFSPAAFPSNLVGTYDYDNSPDFLQFIQGKPIANMGDPLFFTFGAPRARLLKYDVLPNSILVPLVSMRVAALLSSICPNEIQLIPSKVDASDAPIEGYYLLNVIASIAGIDHTQSEIEVIPGTNHIVDIMRLRYRSGAMGGHHLARESQCHTFLWVSEQLAQRFAHEKIKGCVFEPPESIHP